MDINWQKFGKKAYEGIRDAGAPATITVISSGTYDITTGVTTDTSVDYTSHAIIKNYKSDSGQIMNFEEVEITFHSGITPDTIPDLTDQDKIQIITQDKLYDVTAIQAVRPAGVTMIYKAKAKENTDA